MDINLRKANALQHAIKERVLELRAKIKTRGEVTPFSTFETLLDEGISIKLASNQIFDLIDVLYNIRQLVSEANSPQINKLLSSIACMDECIQVAKPIAEATAFPSEEEIKKRIDRATTSEEYQYASMTIGIVPQEVIDTAKSEIARLKKTKVDIQDMLLELNISTKITLADNDVEILQEHNIL